MSDETIGEFVEEVEAASPGSVSRGGMRFTYLGEIQLSAEHLTGEYKPFPQVGEAVDPQ